MAFVIEITANMRFFYDFPGLSLLVNYNNAYRPREERKSS